MTFIAEMSTAAEELPLPRRDVRKKSYRAAAAMVFEKIFQISLPRMYWTRNIDSRRSDSFSLRMFHL
jgi:hypothetical protein